jgi:di/tricarboxylate transporter
MIRTHATVGPTAGDRAARIGLPRGPLLLALAVPATLAAGCGFMLPVATPPNTRGYGTGRVPIGAMLRAGLALDLGRHRAGRAGERDAGAAEFRWMSAGGGR